MPTESASKIPRPYLSLGLMLGNQHVPVLGRCLRSVLTRSSSKALVDEIVIGWNGTDQAGLDAQLVKLGYVFFAPAKKWVGPAFMPTLEVVTFEWPGRFDLARNLYWKHCTGEWILWLDADDEVADAGTPKGLRAIERVEKDYGIVVAPADPNAPVTTFQDYLRQLPPAVNVVFCPYDYTIDEHEYVHVRQKMKRIVRRTAEHVWYSPEQSGVHEILTAIGGTPEVMAETFGFLVQHRPNEEELKRVERNKNIVEQLTKPGMQSDPRHAYDVANAALVAGDLTKANEAISAAIIHAHNDMDRYTYRLARAYVGLQENNNEKMMQEAFAAVGILPELRDAYFIAAEAFFRMSKWPSVLEWYERGACKTPTLLSRDQPLASFVAPRAQAALACCYLGKSERALALVQEMEKEYPLCGLTVEVGTKVRAITENQKGQAALFGAVEFLFTVSPYVAHAVFQSLKLTHALDQMMSTTRWRALGLKCQNAAGEGLVTLKDGLAKYQDGGLVTIDDVLEYVLHVDQILDVQCCEDQRSAKVEWRKRPAPSTSRRIAFYAPIGITRWMCSEFDKVGMGGSESSVALLARELTDLGHEVTVFTNKPGYAGTDVWHGVIQKDCTQFVPAEWARDDIVIYCRAPWQVREDPPATKNVWCWHQDNGYANKWMWNEELVKAQGHLWVSEFARLSLLNDALVSAHYEDRQITLGNGISPKCYERGDGAPPRNPKSVVYASNPSRGLEALLDAWPLVLKQEPEATLTVMCEWNVMLLTHQTEPGFTVPEKLRVIQEKLKASPRTNNLGWQPQEKVIEYLKASHVYCYPGGPMPEGFGVALVQAQACGCVVVAPREGALPEVLGTGEYGAGIWLERKGDREEIASRILDGFKRKVGTSTSDPRHSWPNVARRFLGAVAVGLTNRERDLLAKKVCPPRDAEGCTKCGRSPHACDCPAE